MLLCNKGGYIISSFIVSKEENMKLFNLIKDNFNFRQLIDEYDYKWVHVSFDSTDNKNQIIHKK